MIILQDTSQSANFQGCVSLSEAEGFLAAK
jgi:hypothetical protein